jgi:hypothetical protein
VNLPDRICDSGNQQPRDDNRLRHSGGFTRRRPRSIIAQRSVTNQHVAAAWSPAIATRPTTAIVVIRTLRDRTAELLRLYSGCAGYGGAELDRRFTNNKPREFQRVLIRRARSALTTPINHSEISKKFAHLAARRGCDSTFCFSDR